MALHFDYTNIEGGGEAIEDALWQTAPFMTMAAGINHITEDNVEEFYARVSLTEKVQGAFRNAVENDEIKPHFLSVDEAKSLIGMTSNASRLTPAQFRAQVWRAHTMWNVKGF